MTKDEKVLLEGLAKNITTLAEAFVSLEKTITEKFIAQEPKRELPQSTTQSASTPGPLPADASATLRTDTSNGVPIPQEYRDLVDTILNREFGIEIQPQPNTPTFMFSILVPDKYSPATPQYKQMHGVDRRPKVFNYGAGPADIRAFVELVHNNFDQDTKTKIALDRSQKSN